MKQEALDFLQEARALHRLIAARPTTFLNEATLFKGWTVEEIVRHLHVWNVMADLSRTDPEAFAARIGHVGAGIMSGMTLHLPRRDRKSVV